MSLDATTLSQLLIAVTLYLTTMAARSTTRNRAMRREVRRLRETNEALWEDRHVHRSEMARHGVPLPPAHPRLALLIGQEDDEDADR